MDQETLVTGIRAASRDLVRHWGFLGRSVAGSDLSGSAAHALIEIGRTDGLSARDLSARLQLEKSTVSRLLKSLMQRGEVAETASRHDARCKHLHLTERGRQTLAGIDRVAKAQVTGALSRLPSDRQIQILEGLSTYAGALGQVAPIPHPPAPEIEIHKGYVDGLLGRVAQICALRIQKDYPFGRAFECRIARDMADFLPRADRPENGIWHGRAGEQIVGSISIDGESLGEGRAHLRWFAVTEAASGAGLGRRLLDRALAHCDAQGFPETHLWTLKGLDAARRLYERRGFILAEEFSGDQWGATVTEQKFIRPRPV
ncbi:helix-turn-helix domain-containing GNAT family N-acetyltransferase [Fluviibacterium sp. DFM31]|uniref:Helix-turn-helix domain-containing GNAT family N-acetyltransferase n=1 Tax=Meridianimarinicoccus marinus TaxID=3231483 RepID=A0ABV3LBK7_9RHOB